MNCNLLFLFLLLTAISVIDAIPHQLKKWKINFEKCPLHPGLTPSVTVSPDPIVAGQLVDFTISGVENGLPSTDLSVAITFFDLDGIPIQFPSIFIAKAEHPISVKAPSSLPDSYAVVVEIGDISSDRKLQNYCALAIIGESLGTFSINYIDQIV